MRRREVAALLLLKYQVVTRVLKLSNTLPRCSLRKGHVFVFFSPRISTLSTWT